MVPGVYELEFIEGFLMHSVFISEFHGLFYVKVLSYLGFLVRFGMFKGISMVITSLSRFQWARGVLIGLKAYK